MKRFRNIGYVGALCIAQWSMGECLAAPATEITSNTAEPGEQVSLSLMYQHSVGLQRTRVVIKAPLGLISDIDLSNCGIGSVSCSLQNQDEIVIRNSDPEATIPLGQIGLTVGSDVPPGTQIPIDLIDEEYEAAFGLDRPARGSFGGRILVAPAQDPFEPDNHALFAGPGMLDDRLWRVQTLTGGDDDWLAFENQNPCTQMSTWQMYSQAADPRFRPVVEVFDFERLSDASIEPRERFDACGQTATVFPYDTFSFSTAADGLWRITNCGNVPLQPDEALRYVIVQQVDSLQCGNTGRIEGQVVSAQTGSPVTGARLFVETDENEVTPVNPVDGRFGIGVKSAIPGGGTIEVMLWPLAAAFEGAPVVVSIDDAQTINDVILTVSVIDGLFLNGFE